VKSITWQTVRGLFDWRHPGTITSPVIGFFGAGYYSHIDVITPFNYLRGARSDVIQGIEPGYRDRPQNYEKWAKQTRWTLSVTDEQFQAYWDYSNLQIGKPYDTHGLIETFALGRAWQDDGSWWCSEEVAMNGQVAGLWKLPPEILRVTPGDNVMIFVGAGATRQEMP